MEGDGYEKNQTKKDLMCASIDFGTVFDVPRNSQG